MTVAVREGLLRVADPAAGSFVTATVGLLVTFPAALASGPDRLFSSQTWPFLVAGLIAPGVAGLLFTSAVELAGAARAALLVTAAPLIAAVPAFLLLDEPVHLAIVGGGAMIVTGGIVLGGEHLEGTSFRRLGLAVALAAAALIAVRDNFARWAARHYDVPGLASGWAALVGASALILVYLLVTRRGGTFAAVRRAALPFLPGRAAHRRRVHRTLRGAHPRARDRGDAALRDRIVVDGAARLDLPRAERAHRREAPHSGRADGRRRGADRRLPLSERRYASRRAGVAQW